MFNHSNNTNKNEKTKKKDPNTCNTIQAGTPKQLTPITAGPQ